MSNLKQCRNRVFTNVGELAEALSRLDPSTMCEMSEGTAIVVEVSNYSVTFLSSDERSNIDDEATIL